MIGQYPDTQDFAAMVKDYCATVAAVDENVGKVLQTLTDLGQLDNTAIFYTSDNGFFLGEWQRFDKRFMHDVSIRVPMLVRFPPRARAGSSCEKMVLNVDLAPTILDLAGAPVPSWMHGRSFAPLI